jgi:uncharacterized membrane protein
VAKEKPKMGSRFEVTERITIHRSPEDVYSFVSDYRNDVLWRHGVTEMTLDPPAPVRVGTRTREVMRFFGRRLLTEAEVTEVVPNQRTAFRSSSGPISVTGFRQVEPADGATEITFNLEGEMDSLFSALAPILKPMFRRQVSRDLVRLKMYLERPGAWRPVADRG